MKFVLCFAFLCIYITVLVNTKEKKLKRIVWHHDILPTEPEVHTEKKPVVMSVMDEISEKNLNRMCDKFLEVTGNKSESIILINQVGGGLGHKFRSTGVSTSYALITGKQLFFRTPPDIAAVTDSCFSSREYVGDFSSFRVCKSDGSCFNKTDRIVDLDSSFSVDSALYDLRLPAPQIYNEANRQRLINRGIMTKNQTWESYKRIVYKLLLRPTKELQQDIKDELAALKIRKYSLGVHIRTGGLLANDCESVCMIDQKTLDTVPGLIENLRQHLTSNPKEIVIYISSDSDKAIEYLRRHLNKDYIIISASKYQKGHTTNRFISKEKVKGALLDMHVLSMCDALLTTKASGFSTITEHLSIASFFDHIPVNRSKVQCPPKKKVDKVRVDPKKN